MASYRVVVDFLKREAWHLVEYVDLGTTAHIFVVEKDNARYALKTRRDEVANTSALQVEYRVLQYLNRTPMRQYVPRVGEWLPEVEGFLMEYLRYPVAGEKKSGVGVSHLSRALQTLHSVNLPSTPGIPDDCPHVGAAIKQRFLDLFAVVLRGADYWAHLPQADAAKLARVRAYHATYVGWLTQIADRLAHPQLALTHGDLAGDNIMLTQSGHLAITDWGAARISAALTDVAALSIYLDGSEDERHQFFREYLSGTARDPEEALCCLESLTRVYRYRSCVESLLWLNEAGEEGLDGIGRAHFERQLTAL